MKNLRMAVLWHDPLDGMATVEAIVVKVPHIDKGV